MAGTGARSIAPSLAALEAGSKGANLGQPRLATRVVGMAVGVGTGTGVGVGTGDACGVLRPLCEARIFGRPAVEYTPIAQP